MPWVQCASYKVLSMRPNWRFLGLKDKDFLYILRTTVKVLVQNGPCKNFWTPRRSSSNSQPTPSSRELGLLWTDNCLHFRQACSSQILYLSQILYSVFVSNFCIQYLSQILYSVFVKVNQNIYKYQANNCLEYFTYLQPSVFCQPS